MARDIRQVVADIDGLAPPNSDDLDLERLQALSEEYFSLPGASDHLDVWFHLYERFPDSDGYGVFWSILHGIEAQPTSDVCVVASVRRNPTQFPLRMVNRMLNAGITSADGVDLLGLLVEVSQNKRCSSDIRQDAARFLERQRKRVEPDAAADGGRVPGSS